MTYKIWVNFSGCACYKVEADNLSDAQDAAMEMADPSDCQAWDFDIADD